MLLAINLSAWLQNYEVVIEEPGSTRREKNMPRLPRVRGNDVHYHIILRCNNQERLLRDGEDFGRVLQLLSKTKKEFGFRLYNYELLNSHIHLMLSTHNDFFIDQIMHDFCFRFAKNYNREYGRSGHFWAHRYHSRIILNDRHGLACLRYQHRNAVSAGIVSRPEEWPWSGYHFYAWGSPNDLLEYHPSYLNMVDGDKSRMSVYRRLVYTRMPSDKFKKLFDGRDNLFTKRFQEMLEKHGKVLEQIKTILGEPGSTEKGIAP